MKKYISLLLSITIFLLQSCELDDNTSSDNSQTLKENPIEKKVNDENKLQKISDEHPINPVENNTIDATEEEKEPKKDKSHWRIKYDTIWY